MAWEALKTKVKALNERENSGGVAWQRSLATRCLSPAKRKGVVPGGVCTLGLTGFRYVV